MKIHHPTSVRSLVFSPCLSHPLQAVVGLDNGSIYRWDLQMGQRGQLDRLPVAHAGPILALDWCSTPGSSNVGDAIGADRSWIVSGGLDHTVKARWFLLYCTMFYLWRSGLGPRHIWHVCSYCASTYLYATSVIPCTPSNLAS
jgi:WD40 repeat protein